MNKPIFLFITLIILLAACGSETVPSHETKEAAVISDRIMADNVGVGWTVKQDDSAGSLKASIRLDIKKKDGKPIEQFDITHEKQLHLIVISQDLSYFNHIHPEYRGNGVFEIANEFPAGGSYRVIADFKPAGGDSMSKMEWISIEGGKADPAPVVPDSSLDKVIGGVRVTFSSSAMEARKETTLEFSFTDEKTIEPITDLQPYLGAIGHVVILSEDGQLYVHAHAEEDQGSGPVAKFESKFPRSGIYKVWGQFQRNDKIITASYVLDIQ